MYKLQMWEINIGYKHFDVLYTYVYKQCHDFNKTKNVKLYVCMHIHKYSNESSMYLTMIYVYSYAYMYTLVCTYVHTYLHMYVCTYVTITYIIKS